MWHVWISMTKICLFDAWKKTSQMVVQDGDYSQDRIRKTSSNKQTQGHLGKCTCCNANNEGWWKISFHFKYSWSLQGDHWTVGLVFFWKIHGPDFKLNQWIPTKCRVFWEDASAASNIRRHFGYLFVNKSLRYLRPVFSVNFIITSLAFGCPGGIQKQTQVSNICEITNLVGGWSNPFEKNRQLDSHLPEIFGDADKPSLFLSPKLVIYWPPCSLYL